MGCIRGSQQPRQTPIQSQPQPQTQTQQQKPPMDLDAILNMNKPLNTGPPSCFPPAPQKPELRPGASEQEYKAHMIQKMKVEKYENAVTLYRIKEKNGDQAGMDAVLHRVVQDMSE